MSKKISELEELAVPLDPTDLFEVVTGGSNVKATAQQIADFVFNATLTGDGEVDLDGSRLQINDDAAIPFLIDPNESNKFTRVGAYHPTGDGNFGLTYYSVSDVSVTTNIEASFNDDSKLAQIRLIADATSATAIYYGDTHTLNGQIINPDLVLKDFADDSAAESGGVPVGGLYHTSGTVKIRLT